MWRGKHSRCRQPERLAWERLPLFWWTSRAVTDNVLHSPPEMWSCSSFPGRLRSERGGLISWSSGVRLTVQVLEEASSVDKSSRTYLGSLDRAGVDNFVERTPREPCNFSTLGIAEPF